METGKVPSTFSGLSAWTVSRYFRAHAFRDIEQHFVVGETLRDYPQKKQGGPHADARIPLTHHGVETKESPGRKQHWRENQFLPRSFSLPRSKFPLTSDPRPRQLDLSQAVLDHAVRAATGETEIGPTNFQSVSLSTEEIGAYQSRRERKYGFTARPTSGKCSSRLHPPARREIAVGILSRCDCGGDCPGIAHHGDSRRDAPGSRAGQATH